jgi:hypothetical protein
VALLGLAAVALLVAYADLVCASWLRAAGAAPSLMILVPLLLAMHGRPRRALSAILACTAVGAILSVEPLPLLPVVHGGLAAREALFRTHPLTEALAVALVTAAATAVLDVTHLVRFGAPGIGVIVERALLTGAITGLVAPVAFRLLRLLPPVRAFLLPRAS